jgi:hypothetical protein
VLWDTGIKTYRLEKGVFNEVDEENYSALLLRENSGYASDVVEQGPTREVVRVMRKREEIKNLQLKVKSKSDVSNILRSNKLPNTITFVQIINFLCIVILVSFFVSEYFITQERFNNIIETVVVVQQIFQSAGSICNAMFNYQELMFLLQE